MAGNRLVYSVVFYLLTMSVVLLAKPAMLFDAQGEIKEYGVGHDKTVFSLGVVSIVLAILCYYLFSMVDLIFGE